MPKVRQINRPENEVGKKRQALYAQGITRIENAIRVGFPLEAITLCESLMSDRLEARRAWKAQQTSKARGFSTLGTLASVLCADRSEPAKARSLYAKVAAWAGRRNSAVHEMFKLAEGDEKSWLERYDEAQDTAKAGVKLAREVSTLVRSLNRAKSAETSRASKHKSPTSR